MVARHHDKFGRTPVKGSLMRRMLKMMLRPEGATTFELIEVGLRNALIHHYTEVLRNEKGWDVRLFPCPRYRRRSPKGYVYKIVGKMRWDGSYRSLITKDQLDGLTEGLQQQS
jgi:hypothetical protein